MASNFKEVFSGVQQVLREQPEQRVATFEASSRQVEGLRSEVAIRDFRITVDEPPALAGTDRGPNPAELVLAALATCQEITYRLYADKLGIPVTSVAVKLEGDIDLCGFFAVDEKVRPGFRGVRGTVAIDSPAAPEEIQRLKAEVDRHCPVLDILSNPTPVTIELAPAPAARRAAE